MAKIILELHREDFIEREWILYDKGIKSLNYSMLKTKQRELFIQAHEVYIYLGRDKYYLKRK